MKKLILMILALAFTAVPLAAQETGSVSGIVYDGDNNLVGDAHIRLTGADSYFTETGDDGTFLIVLWTLCN